MDDETNGGLFPSLLDGLQTFHARVEGSDGTYRQALLVSGQSPLVVNISGSVLEVVRRILVWLRDGIVALSQRLVSIDAVVAMVEVALELLSELEGGIEIPLPGLEGATAGISDGLSVVGEFAGNVPQIGLLPGPEVVADLQTVLEQLVGVAEGEGLPGALDQLLSDIDGLAA